MELCPHPTRPEALGIDAQGTLSRWDLSSDEPTRLAHLSLEHHDGLVATDGRRVFLPFSLDPAEHLSPCAVEVREYESLQRLGQSALPRGATMLQCTTASRRGWLAVASYEESVLVLDRELRGATQVPSTAWTSGCSVDRAGRLLAAAHTDQGGGYLAVYRVRRMRGLRTGTVRTRVDVVHEALEREGVPVEHRDFADTFASTAFGPGGATLAVYETNSGLKTGAVSLYDVETGALRWWVPMPALTGARERGARPDGADRLGYPSRVAFSPDGTEVIAGAAGGAVVCLRARDGSHRRTLHAGDFDVHLLFVEPSRGRVWALDQRSGRPVAVGL